MGVYDRQIATCKRVIAAKGALCTWRKNVLPLGDDPAQPSAGTPLDFLKIPIAFFPNKQLNLLTSLSMLKGTDVASGAMYGLMAAQTFKPELLDQVLNTPYGTLGIEDKNGIAEFNVNGETIFYTLRFTR